MTANASPLVFVLVLVLLAVMAPPPAGAQEPEGSESPALLIAQGRVSYVLYCRSCHGESGKGDGSAAELLKLPPADLTSISARNDGEFPTQEVFDMIDGRKPGIRAHGVEMPIWGDAFMLTDETRDEKVIERKITRLVHYLESIQAPESSP